MSGVCDCRYQGPLLEDGALDAAVSGGAASPEFTKLCAWIVSELGLYCKLEENVQATNCKKLGFNSSCTVRDIETESYGINCTSMQSNSASD